jgi:hypothetical protein
VSRLARTNPLWWEAVVSRPSYPNWQRKRIQNPCSVSSNLTEGTQRSTGVTPNSNVVTGDVALAADAPVELDLDLDI